MPDFTSRRPGFANLTQQQRIDSLKSSFPDLPGDLSSLMDTGAIDADLVNRLVENAIGVLPVPLGIATNMLVDGRDVLVPMATEESSVIAAVCNAAKRCRATGGFHTSYSGSLSIAQVQIIGLSNPEAARLTILEHFDDIAARCAELDPKLHEIGGGLRDLEVRVLRGRTGVMVVVHLIVDTADAMGANAVNTMAEGLAPHFERWTDGTVLLRILSNLADRRLARARAVWKADEIGGPDTVDRMLIGGDLAEIDPYRATTHNKGIMNGVSAVVLATGNDTRAIEAGAHAFAARSGHYGPLTRWEKTADGDLAGSIELPLSLGIVGGATRVHPTAQLCLGILGTKTAESLARVTAAVGLAQNFGALRALATEGIQKGHMALHAQNVAVAAGATGNEVDKVAQTMRASGKINEATALAELLRLRG